MWSVTIKGLLAHKVRLGLTALAILLGVAFVSGTYILTDTMNRAFDSLFETVNRGVAVVVQGEPKFKATGPGGESAGPGERVPASVLDQVRTVPGVKAAEGDLSGYAQAVGTDGKPVSTGGAPTFGGSWISDPDLAVATLRQGHPPTNASEVAVDANTANKGSITLGDRIQVLLQGPPIRASVVGIFGYGEGGKEDTLGGATFIAFDPATAQKVLNGGGKFDSIRVAADQDVSPDTLRSKIAAVLPSGFEANTGQQQAASDSQDVKDQLKFLTIALLVFAGIALFVGAFIIFNTFSILLAQRTRELALLRALGATPGQVARSVVLEAAIVGLVASAVGVVAGFGIAIGLKGLLAAIGAELPSTTTQLQPRTIIVAMVVGTVTTLVASVGPALRASRVPPIAALRDTQPTASAWSPRRTIAGLVVLVAGIAALAYGLFGGTKNAAAMVGLGAALVFFGVAILSPLFARPIARVIGAPLARLGISGRLGRENASRNPRRTASTSAALMIGLALVGFVSIFAASLKASASQALEETLKADYIVSNTQFQPFSQDVAARLRADSRFSGVVEFRTGLFGLNGKAQTVTGANTASLPATTNVGISSGSFTNLGVNQILVFKNTATDHGWRRGSVIPAEFARTGRQNLTVAGIYDDDRLLGSYVVSLATFERNFSPSEQLDQFVLLKTAPGVSQAEAKAAVTATTKAFPNVRIQDQAEFRQTQADLIDQILVFVTALLGLALIIALFGIVTTLALSVFERTREIGLLRAVGMSRRQTRSMIRWESVIIAVFGALLGIAVGIFFGWAMVQALKDQGITVLAFPVGQLLLYVVLAGIAGVLAALLPARRAARLDVLRAITTE
jgi:putative ABC transport system permease protein